MVIGIRDPARVDLGARLGQDSGGVDDVLEAVGHAVYGAPGAAFEDLGLGLLRSGSGEVGRHRRPGLEPGVQRLDPRDQGLDELDRRHLFAGDTGGRLGGAQLVDIGCSGHASDLITRPG